MCYYNNVINKTYYIKFKLEKRVMTDEQFLLNSDVKIEKIVTEAELQEMKKED